MLSLSLYKSQQTNNDAERAALTHETLEQLSELLDDHGDELREAIAIVANAEGEVNAGRSQQIAQYHRNRVYKVEQSIDSIDESLSSNADNPTKTAELNSQRQDLVYQLEDHTKKIDTRSHGLQLSKMRRKHR
ncbi:MAG: hypothetical protein AB8B81_17955 [Halioglobus sp.]